MANFLQSKNIDIKMQIVNENKTINLGAITAFSKESSAETETEETLSGTVTTSGTIETTGSFEVTLTEDLEGLTVDELNKALKKSLKITVWITKLIEDKIETARALSEAEIEEGEARYLCESFDILLDKFSEYDISAGDSITASADYKLVAERKLKDDKGNFTDEKTFRTLKRGDIEALKELYEEYYEPASTTEE